jgi:Carboxypeptidase regulatory-like domain
MKPSLILLIPVLAVLAATSACSVERTSSVLGPTSASAVPAKSSAPSMLGTWVVQGTSTTASVRTSSSAPSALPDFSSCSNFRWEVTSQTATQVAGTFTADCAGDVTVRGTITGQLGGTTIPIVLSGELTHAGEGCPFSLTGSGTPIDSQTFHLTYSGTTCLGPMQGTNTLSLAPHSAPTAFTIAGTITDGTSGGILPGIEVSSSGMAVRSDAAGHYQLTGVPAGAVAVQFAAASYVTQTKTLTLTENSVLDAILQRFAPPAPAPAPAPSGGDQIDMHAVIVRGGCCSDVANWPVTTQIRVLDFNAGGAFVDFSAKNSWPEVTPPGWDGGIAYTLWMVVKVNGQWITAGGVEFWHGLERQGGPPSRFASNWYYSPQVWGELASHQPSVGEQVGFFVTAGDQRAKDVRIVTERSNVVLVPFPSDGGGYYPF